MSNLNFTKIDEEIKRQKDFDVAYKHSVNKIASLVET